MAADSWHGLRGPADFFIPDDTRELIFSGLWSVGAGGASYILNQREVTRTLARMAQHHVTNVYAANPRAVYPRAALRAAAQSQTVRGSVFRGVSFIFGATTTALVGMYLLGASLPRQGVVNPQLTAKAERGVVGSWTL